MDFDLSLPGQSLCVNTEVVNDTCDIIEIVAMGIK